MKIVDRWVLEQDDAGWELDAAQDDVHRGAAARPIRLPVVKLARDILVPAQCVEVVLLVVVQRRLVAQPLPRRVGIVVDREIVRVVIDLDRARLSL